MPAAVVIAASNLMPGLRERLAEEGELVTFADTEPIQALQAIIERRPHLVVLERLFAATPRGAALINRIKTDPQIGSAEVRVMSHTGDYVRQVARPTLVEIDAPAPIEIATVVGGDDFAAVPIAAPPAPDDTPRQLDWHGTRRAPRHRIRPGVEIQLDGNPVSIVDMSIVGAQVVSATILRPNQRVRVSVPTDNFMMRFRGTVAWAKFELPKPSEPPRYRAGVEFTDADAAAMNDYCLRHKG